MQQNSDLILGIGILLVIAGGMFLLYDIQKTRLMMEAGVQESMPQSRDGLLAEIAALDESYERGEVSQELYGKRREALKEALRRHLE